MKRRLLLVVALFLGLVVLGAIFVLTTAVGTRWVVGDLASRVPGLVVEGIEGSVATGLVLRGVDWTDGIHRLQADRVTLDASVGAAAFAPRRLSAVVAQGVTLTLGTAPPATDAAAPAQGEPLPALVIDALRIEDARIAWPSGRTSTLRADAGLALSGRRIELSALHAIFEDWTLDGEATLDLDRAQPLAAARLDVARTGPPAIAATLTISEGPQASPLSLVLRQPLQAELDGALAHDLGRADLRLRAPAQDVEAWGIGLGISADLTLAWDGERAQPRGVLARDGIEVTVAGGALRPGSAGLQLDALTLAITGRGTVRVDGRLPLGDTQAWDLVATTDALDFPRADAAPLRVRGSVRIDGAAATPRLSPELTLDAPGLPSATTAGAITLTDGGLRIDALALLTPGGGLTVDGQVGGADGDVLALRARGVDPGRFAPAWPGALDADLQWRGRLRGAPVKGQLELQRLDGTLRARPLSGTGTLRIVGGTADALDLRLAAGRARLLATLADGGARGEATLDVPDLADLAPGLAGRLDATWERAQQDTLTARIDGLRAGSWRLLGGELELTLPRRADGALAGRATLTELQGAGQPLRRVVATLEGTPGAHRVQLRAEHAEGTLQLGIGGSWRDAQWRGALDAFDATAGKLAARLREPAALAWSDAAFELGPLCVDAAGGTACLDAEGTPASGRAGLLLDGWSLAALRPVWPALPELEGLVEGSATVVWRDGAVVEGTLALASPRGLARLPDRPDLDLGYRALVLDGLWSGEGGRIDGGADLIPDGRLDLAAVLTPGPDGVPGVDATLDVVVRQLDGIEAFTTMIAEPEGEIRGQLRLQGGALPRSLSGAIALTGFTAQVPSRAIRVRDGVLVLAGVPGQLLVRGSVVSGDGTLTLDGRIDTGDPVPTLLRLGGKDFRFSNTPTLSLVATPDLTLAHRDGRWQLDGRLDIPRARVDASRLEAGVDRSPDVVVADAEQPGGPPRPWRARVKVSLGDDVRLEGFGFDGTLAGELDISQRQGAQAVANGEITLRGRYQAYGQRLQIERGGLRYANSPLAEPTLDLRAERKVRDRTVALQITGNALRPESQIVGSQGLSDTEALALLVTGRPLNQAGSDDRERLSDAAAALGTVGSDLLTRNLRGRLGLDELGVSNDTGLDGEAFTLGKYLSPRLYVGYGIGLLTRGEVFTVRYLVTDRIELEASAGSSTRAAVNWRLER